MGTDTSLNQTNGLIFVNTIDTLLFKCGFSFVFALLCFAAVKKKGSCSGYFFWCTILVSLRKRHCGNFGFYPLLHQGGKGQTL